MIFVVLCLTTFSVLSYVTANADFRLTETSRAGTDAYYAADAAAQQLARLDGELARLAEEAGEKAERVEEYVRLVSSYSFSAEKRKVGVLAADGQMTLSFAAPIDER